MIGEATTWFILWSVVELGGEIHTNRFRVAGDEYDCRRIAKYMRMRNPEMYATCERKTPRDDK